jgi:hypothetical protein
MIDDRKPQQRLNDDLRLTSFDHNDLKGCIIAGYDNVFQGGTKKYRHNQPIDPTSRHNSLHLFLVSTVDWRA